MIVNHLDELKEKYHNYPRTAYEKPAKGAPRGRNALLKPSEELAKIVGADPLSRGDATKKLWTYIKKHHLQDPNNKRTIVPDKVLAEVIGKKPLDMMRLATHLSRHLH